MVKEWLWWVEHSHNAAVTWPRRLSSNFEVQCQRVCWLKSGSVIECIAIDAVLQPRWALMKEWLPGVRTLADHLLPTGCFLSPIHSLSLSTNTCLQPYFCALRSST